MRKLSLILLVLLFTSCGGGGGGDSASSSGPLDACSTIVAKIINGTVCSQGGSPVVQLNLLNRRGQTVGLCSGAVIAPNAVLTAAHCCSGGIRRAQVVTERGDVNSNSIVSHPEFRASLSDQALFADAAIVFADIPPGVASFPIRVSSDPSEGESAIIAGFGVDASDNDGVLRGGNTTISAVSSNHLFTSFDGTESNTCVGDSGGPLLTVIGDTAAISGIVSSGAIAECTAGDTALYTKVSNLTVANFIRAQVPGAGFI